MIKEELEQKVHFYLKIQLILIAAPYPSIWCSCWNRGQRRKGRGRYWRGDARHEWQDTSYNRQQPTVHIVLSLMIQDFPSQTAWCIAATLLMPFYHANNHLQVNEPTNLLAKSIDVMLSEQALLLLKQQWMDPAFECVRRLDV